MLDPSSLLVSVSGVHLHCYQWSRLHTQHWDLLLYDAGRLCLQVVQGCLGACTYFQGLASKAELPLEQAVAVLQIQARLLHLASSLPVDSTLQDGLSQAQGTHLGFKGFKGLKGIFSKI